MDVLIVWGKFLLLLVLIYIFGTKASHSADIIADKKGLAKAFMGVVFISMITSFPELFTGISAASTVQSADIAMGEILGSCIFNLLIIAIIELTFRKVKIYQLTGRMNMLPLGFSIILISMVTLAISTPEKFRFSIFNVGIFSIIIFAFYFTFMRIIFVAKKDEDNENGKPIEKQSAKKEIIVFIYSALIIIALGWYLPTVGKELAIKMNWTDSFVGVVFLALVTSFPELIVSIAAVRIGSVEMCLGNIAGSNMFNIAILFVIDIFYRKGPLMGSVSANNVPTGIIAILMNFIIFFAVARQSSYKFFKIISVNAVMIITLYILALFIIF